ncbi:hypothetical protein M440DRAFT_1020826 [Trichoderma longibrachiatum ATCC 18648]|uniref:Uncharacterized protein n=1 Tax=Trichoderma longibrachiatum ATCC 18648 TaxID=983965 RepID=A0A2T4CJB0_TRILO|nr:hypothetical protein M440DRAFT_1020826 [Trichoderma longibrachiatum ATCC 18648]
MLRMRSKHGSLADNARSASGASWPRGQGSANAFDVGSHSSARSYASTGPLSSLHPLSSIVAMTLHLQESAGPVSGSLSAPRSTGTLFSLTRDTPESRALRYMLQSRLFKRMTFPSKPLSPSFPHLISNPRLTSSPCFSPFVGGISPLTRTWHHHAVHLR